MITDDLKTLQIKVYAGASLEKIDKELSDILIKANKIETLLNKISVSLRNGGYGNDSEFGKLYIEINKYLENKKAR